MPTPLDHVPADATSLARQIAQLRQEVKELRAARRLENSTIAGGRGLTVQAPDTGTSVTLTASPTDLQAAGFGDVAAAVLLGSGVDGEITPGFLAATVNPGTSGAPVPAIQACTPNIGYGFASLLMSAGSTDGVDRPYARLAAGPNVVWVYDDLILVDAPTVQLTGTLQAASIATGSVTITPTAANTPTSAMVTGLNVAGTTFTAYVSPQTVVPGTQVTGWGASAVSSAGLTVTVTRTNTTATILNWMVVGQ